MSRRKASKLITLVLTACILLTSLLVGCGTDKTATSETTATQGEAAQTSTGETPKENVKLVYWNRVFGGDAWYKPLTEKQVADFQKENPNIQIAMSAIPDDAWDQKYKSAQAAGTAPDFAVWSYNHIPNRVKEGTLLALDDYMDPKVFEDLYENVNEMVSIGGKHYAYPMLLEPATVLFYRKDMFKEAGLDPEKPPKTWAELTDYAKKLTKPGRFGLILPQASADLGWATWGWQVSASGHMALTDDWSKADVMNDGYTQLLNLYKTLYADKSVPKQALGSYPDIKPFGEGKAAMAFCGSWAAGPIKTTYKNIVPNVGVACAPTIDGNQQKTTTTLGGWTMGIDAKSKHPKEAAQFITWDLASDTARSLEFFKASSFAKFSPRKSVDEAMKNDPEASNDPWRKLIAEQIVPHGVAEAQYPWDISMAVSKAIESVATKGTAVDAALTQADKEINNFIAKNKLAGTNPKAK